MKVREGIHPTAVIEEGAELAPGVQVGPFCVVGAHVRLGKNCRLHSHVVIAGHTTLGEDNEIFPFASVGHSPQDLKYKGEPTTLEIGNGNTIRECATLQPGTVQGGGKTVIGNGNLFMAYTHVAHDCIIGDGNILANSAQLAGHVVIENGANVGSTAGIHQFCRVGSSAMVGAGSMVAKDVPPFCIAQGDRAILRGLNVIGLKRKGFNAEKLSRLKLVYQRIFLSGSPTVELAIDKCREEGLLDGPEINQFVDFVKSSSRGVVRPANDLEYPDLD